MKTKTTWWKYAEFYPEEDEKGYDGKHSGGLKGLKPNAPKEAVEEYKKYKENEERGIMA